ncbi:MAG TPA: ECF-type sigma factor [Blastocatellia bacterium]|nr:ECF-type sigma factor [Blastocatellia bacterium]
MNTHAPEDAKQPLPEDKGDLSRGEVTRLLSDWNNGDAAARDRLVTLVYGELRRMAHLRLLGERVWHSMQTGTLAHEVYLRLFEANGVPCRSREDFYSIIAQLMREILVDAARKRRARKRGGNQIRIPLEDATAVAPSLDLDLVALDEALDALARLNERLSQIVELRYFAGLTIEETADVLGVSTDVVKRRLKKARIYLHDELTRTKGASDGS